jgi:hypothetical protein
MTVAQSLVPATFSLQLAIVSPVFYCEGQWLFDTNVHIGIQVWVISVHFKCIVYINFICSIIHVLITHIYTPHKHTHHTHIHTHTHKHTYIHTHTRAHTHTYIHTHTHTHTDARAHTHTYIFLINFLKCFCMCKSVGRFPYPCACYNLIWCFENKQELNWNELKIYSSSSSSTGVLISP